MTPEQEQEVPTSKIIKRLCQDWTDDHTHIQELCLKHGCTIAQVEGDEHGMPSISDLADLLASKIKPPISAEQIEAAMEEKHDEG